MGVGGPNGSWNSWKKEGHAEMPLISTVRCGTQLGTQLLNLEQYDLGIKVTIGVFDRLSEQNKA